MIREKKEGIHTCDYAYGKIKDVTIRKNQERISIHCKKCGDQLKEDEVDPKMLKLIQNDTRRTNTGRSEGRGYRGREKNRRRH